MGNRATGPPLTVEQSPKNIPNPHSLHKARNAIIVGKYNLLRIGEIAQAIPSPSHSLNCSTWNNLPFSPRSTNRLRKADNSASHPNPKPIPAGGFDGSGAVWYF